MKLRDNSIQKTALALAVSLTIPALSMSVAQADEGFLLEEVIVTAQKREQSLQDVPVSVSVVTGDAISKAGMTNLDELSTHVPNLSITEGSQNTTITMRGLGSGINQGFDQSVGMFVDGIYAGRDRQFRAPFLDVAAVEVLRGPQGTLFGKNTIAGAINLTTAKPSESLKPLFAPATSLSTMSILWKLLSQVALPKTSTAAWRLSRPSLTAMLRTPLPGAMAQARLKPLFVAPWCGSQPVT